jgi:hypothetical protein
MKTAAIIFFSQLLINSLLFGQDIHESGILIRILAVDPENERDSLIESFSFHKETDVFYVKFAQDDNWRSLNYRQRHQFLNFQTYPDKPVCHSSMTVLVESISNDTLKSYVCWNEAQSYIRELKKK